MTTRFLSMTGVLASALALGCAIDPARVNDHRLYADDRAVRSTDGAVTFAVVGNTRGTVPGLDRAAGAHFHGAAVGTSIMEDIRGRVGPAGPRFLVHMGDGVRGSTVFEWGAFDRRMEGLLLRGAGDDEVTPGAAGIPGVPVAGDREAAGDKRFRGLEGAWPGVGAEIGYNRVATWSQFDLETAGHTWRVLVMDSGKSRLGSRWNEQRNWIKRVVKGEYDGLLLFMHDPVLDLGTREDVMNVGGGPAELLELIEAETGMMKVPLVFAGGTHTSQALLPDGPFGTAHLGAGGGGAPAMALRRWGPADTAGRNEDVQLEPMFDLALMQAFERWSRQTEIPAVAMDEARASGSFEGFTGAYHPEHFPTYGWWQVTAYGETLDCIFRLRTPDGAFRDIYRLHFAPANGWKASRLDVR